MYSNQNNLKQTRMKTSIRYAREEEREREKERKFIFLDITEKVTRKGDMKRELSISSHKIE